MPSLTLLLVGILYTVAFNEVHCQFGEPAEPGEGPVLGGARIGGLAGGMGGMAGGAMGGAGGGGAGGGFGMNQIMGTMNAIPTMVSGMRRGMAREGLMKVVRFVVHDTAVPTPEMINYAMVAGAAPTTPAEKAAYLRMLKDIARKTPMIVARYLKTTMVNGIPVTKLDEIGIDAYVTKKAMEYAAVSGAAKTRKAASDKLAKEAELGAARLQRLHAIQDQNMLFGGGFGLGMGGGFNGGFHDGFGGGLDFVAQPMNTAPQARPAAPVVTNPAPLNPPAAPATATATGPAASTNTLAGAAPAMSPQQMNMYNMQMQDPDMMFMMNNMGLF